MSLKRKYIYVVSRPDGPVKIGKTVNPSARIAGYTPAPTDEIVKHFWANCSVRNADAIEALVKERLTLHRVDRRSEWFSLPVEEVLAAVREAMLEYRQPAILLAYFKGASLPAGIVLVREDGSSSDQLIASMRKSDGQQKLKFHGDLALKEYRSDFPNLEEAISYAEEEIFKSGLR